VSHQTLNGSAVYPSPQDGHRQLTLQDAFDVLRRHWKLVSVCVLATLAATLFVMVRRPHSYSAEVLLQREVNASPLENFALASGSTVTPEELASQIEIIRTRAVLGPVVDSLGLRVEPKNEQSFQASVSAVAVGPRAASATYNLEVDEDRVVLSVPNGRAVTGPRGAELSHGDVKIKTRPDAARGETEFRVLGQQAAVRALREDLRVEVVRGTRLIQIRYRAKDPERAAAVASAVANSYQAHAAEKARDEAHRRRLFLASQFANVADSLSVAQQMLSTYQEGSGTLNPQVEGEALANELMLARNELRTARFQESVLQSLSTSLTASGTDEGVGRLLAISQDLLPAGEVLYRRLQELEAERGRLTASRIGYTAEAAPVQVVDSLIRVAKADMRTVAAQSLKLYKSKREEAELRVGALEQQVSQLPARASTFVRHEQRVDAVQKTFDLLASKYYEAQIAEAVEAGDVQIVDTAAIPAEPDPKHIPRFLVLAVLLGALIGVAGAFVAENLDNSIRTVEDTERVTALDVLAIVPRVPSEGGKNAWSSPTEASPAVAEAFKMLRTALRFSRSQRPKVIAVTSPGPGEGKSFTAANLAFALGQELPRVLLIDADLRRPSQQKYFSVSDRRGVSDVLVGDVPFAGAVHHVSDSVDLLTAGTLAPHPAELLGSLEFTTLLTGLREMYDAVVLDTPPALLAADTTIIAPLVDGIVVVARANLTDRTALSRALDQLRRASAPLLGLVLNASERGTSYGSYGVQYGDYYPNGSNGKHAAEQTPARWRKWVPVIKQ
jgi:polysaccharide biosynthesis transport protein